MRFERVNVNKGAAILYSYEKGVFSDSKRVNFPAGAGLLFVKLTLVVHSHVS